MVTSGLNSNEETPLPVSYAIPSEVIAPYVKALNFKTPKIETSFGDSRIGEIDGDATQT